MKSIITYASTTGHINGIIETNITIVGDSVLNLARADNIDELIPGNVIVKCQHCGQYAARKTACKSCGAPVD